MDGSFSEPVIGHNVRVASESLLVRVLAEIKTELENKGVTVRRKTSAQYCFLNLRGETDDVLALCGDAFSEAEATDLRKNDKVFDATFYTWQEFVWCM